MSSTATSGTRRRRSARAASPEAAEPTSSSASLAPTARVTPSRNSGWSSARYTRTRGGAMVTSSNVRQTGEIIIPVRRWPDKPPIASRPDPAAGWAGIGSGKQTAPQSSRHGARPIAGLQLVVDAVQMFLGGGRGHAEPRGDLARREALGRQREDRRLARREPRGPVAVAVADRAGQSILDLR